MKRTLSFMVMALALLLTQCRKPEVKFPSPVAPEGTTVSMTVTAGPGSKTDITAAGAIKWSEGDKLYVGDGTKYVGYLTLQGAGGSATGTFSGDVTLTGITEGVAQTFHFYYLGSTAAPAVDATSVDVDFSSQNIYADVNNKLVNASAQHVGYGSAKGTVKDGVVTGINVTLVSKVALACFSFTDGTTPYSGALTLSGVSNKMTVKFNGAGFSYEGSGDGISLTNTSASEKYVMLVPTGGTGDVALSFDGGGKTGGATIEGGIQSNKFYGKTEPIPVNLTAPAPTHEYVDLGLPSGLLWATCNLGASSPEEYGDYYAWGETSTKSDYTWSTYKWCNGSSSTLTKYNTDLSYGNVDNKTTLELSDDAARANWGGSWRMPTEADFTELKNNTNMSWTTESGVAGWKCANNSDATKYIFLPAAGYRDGSSLSTAGSFGYYWSSSLSTSYPYCGRRLYFFSSNFLMNTNNRYGGLSVRPVRGGATPEPPATPKFTVDDDDTTVEFAPGNLYWDGSAFKFEANQWDYSAGYYYEDELLGFGMYNWDPNHVSHFYWSKTASVAYASIYSGDGASTSDVFFTNATLTTANHDFHVNGETGENQWRTLSEAEWNYLLYTRADASSLHAWKELDSGTHNGLVILPDGTDASVMSSISSTSDLATHGAVFLPAAGNRGERELRNFGSNGDYWSSTPYEGGASNAHYMNFMSGGAGTDRTLRWWGSAVRLVR